MSTAPVGFVLKLPLAQQRVRIVEETRDNITAAQLPLQGWHAEALDRRMTEH